MYTNAENSLIKHKKLIYFQCGECVQRKHRSFDGHQREERRENGFDAGNEVRIRRTQAN